MVDRRYLNVQKSRNHTNKRILPLPRPLFEIYDGCKQSKLFGKYERQEEKSAPCILRSQKIVQIFNVICSA